MNKKTLIQRLNTTQQNEIKQTCLKLLTLVRRLNQSIASTANKVRIITQKWTSQLLDPLLFKPINNKEFQTWELAIIAGISILELALNWAIKHLPPGLKSCPCYFQRSSNRSSNMSYLSGNPKLLVKLPYHVSTNCPKLN